MIRFDFAADLRHAARGLRRQPGRALLIAVTMALGIGTTTALFGVVRGVLLEPLPWPDAERLVRLWETREGATRSWPWRITNGSYRAWAESPSTIEGLAAWELDAATLTEAGAAAQLRHAAVTPSLFGLLRTGPLLGTVFATGDPDREGVLVLSEGLWEERFGRSPGAIGRVVRLDGAPHRIVGVMPRGFDFPDGETRAWTRLEVPPVEGGGVRLLRAVARLTPGATPEQAAEEATARAAGAPRLLVEEAIFGSRGAPRVRARTLLASLTEEVRPALLLLMAAAGLLLAAATANVAGVQLATATARRRELAVRAAVGAGRGRLASLLLAENLLLALAGGAAGLLLAGAIHLALPALLPPDFPRLREIAVDVRVAAFALGLSLAAALGFGLLPALFAGRVRLTEALTEDGGGSLGAGRSAAARFRAVLLAGQVAVACVLLLGGLQLGRSFFAELGAERGYGTAGVLVARLALPNERYTPERRGDLIGTLLERLEADPRVERAAFTNVHPLSANDALAVFAAVRPAPADGDDVPIQAAVRTVSAGYFEVLGRHLVAGRYFDERDETTAIVSRSFADRFLSDSPIGSILVSHGDVPDREVVGVVEDAHPARLSGGARPEVLAPAPLHGGLRHQWLSVVVKTRQQPEPLAPTLRAILSEQDRTIAPDWIRPLDDLLGEGLARPRLYAALAGAFAASALLIAGVGLFGVLSYTVALRRREIGLRIALGARPWDVVRMIGRRTLALCAAGVTAGLALSVAGARVLEGLLWGVRPLDPPAVAAVVSAIAVVAVLASLAPATRAARLDPQRALRDR